LSFVSFVITENLDITNFFIPSFVAYFVAPSFFSPTNPPSL